MKTNTIALIASLLSASTTLHGAPALSSASTASDACPADESNLKLPPGFCASLYADGIGHARHLAVAANGVVYVNTWSGRYYGNDQPHAGGFLVALKDTRGSGKADVVQRFGETVQSGGHGGTGIALYDHYLYAESNDKIIRYSLTPGSPAAGSPAAGSIVPDGAPQTVISGLPLTGDHPMHPFAIDASGALYLDLASATNACQKKNRTRESPGVEPCVELQTRGGVWRYDAAKLDQKFSSAQRYATGLRNAEGYGIDNASHRIFVTQHGRDQLHSNWPDIIKDPALEATLPSEEVLLLQQGGDYGWPTCYFDPFSQRLVLAPEYGGDGSTAGLCAQKLAPVAVYPAHWAPNDMVFSGESGFPARYRNGLLIAFHGSWNRAPYAQAGYNVVFQPLAADKAGGACEIFADGFAGANASPEQAAHRPSGLAIGPDGALYVADDVAGRIYKISYHAGANPKGAITPCPRNTAAPAPAMTARARPPEGVHPDAGAAASLPAGVTATMVATGDAIFHGQIAGAGCTGCHGANGTGSALGPDLTGGKWIWSDGSVAGIASVITRGVAEPKNYRAAMPALGGAELSAAQVDAVAAYVWTLSHHEQTAGAQ